MDTAVYPTRRVTFIGLSGSVTKDLYLFMVVTASGTMRLLINKPECTETSKCQFRDHCNVTMDSDLAFHSVIWRNVKSYYCKGRFANKAFLSLAAVS